MTIWEKVKTALLGLNAPTTANIFLVASDAQLPDQFLVYNLVSSPAEQHADNQETLRSNRVQVSVYSRSGLTNLPDVAGAMLAAGFMRGPQREIPYNQVTRHFGLALEFVLMEES